MRQNPTHTNQHSHKGGDSRERKKKRRERGDGWGGERKKRGKSRNRRKWESRLPFTPNGGEGGETLSSNGCFFQEGNRSGPHCCALPLRTEECVSPHTLLLSLPTACWQARESTRSDSHALCIHQARSICVHGQSLPSPSTHTHPLCADSSPHPITLLLQPPLAAGPHFLPDHF